QVWPLHLNLTIYDHFSLLPHGIDSLMYWMDQTYAEADANIAFDEAILEAAEANEILTPILRVWEPANPVVVLGRSSKVESEVDIESCTKSGIPVLRRCSGGATILTSPGCLMYAVVLSYECEPRLRSLDFAHQFVISRISQTINSFGIQTTMKGTCDLTFNGRKFSGNALRCKKNWLLYHGTLICKGMNTSLISRYLRMPERQPAYRDGRSHQDFVGSLPVETDALKTALKKNWKCEAEFLDLPTQRTIDLVDTKYSQDTWNLKI
ncbi:MAG: lipoate--protein ligase family protein, partial [Planctomycetota bacterium]